MVAVLLQSAASADDVNSEAVAQKAKAYQLTEDFLDYETWTSLQDPNAEVADNDEPVMIEHKAVVFRTAPPQKKVRFTLMSELIANTELRVAADTFRGFGDGRSALFNPLPFATASSAGTLIGFNTAVPILSSNISFQIGGTYGWYDFKGRTIDDPGQGASIEQQAYITFGLFKRSDVSSGDRLSWGFVFDQFYGHQWGWTADEIDLGQFRGMIGFALNRRNEVGVLGSFGTNEDRAGISSVGANINTTVRPMNQLSGYFKHTWHFGGNTMVYVGGFDNADVASWQFGLQNSVPLNHSLSLYTNANYVAPGSRTGLPGASEEQWNAQMGFAWTLGRKAFSPTVSGPRGLPLIPVATNGSFLITN